MCRIPLPHSPGRGDGVGFCGPLSVGFDIVKPLNEVLFGRKNKSVANQN